MQEIFTLKKLIENEFFVACPFLSTDQFISFCTARSIKTSKEQLEQLEKLRLFFPVARIARPIVKIKIEYSEDRREWKRLGILENNEEWLGDTIEEYAHFNFERDEAEDWFNNDILWDPSAREFEEWKNFNGEGGWKFKESYYSIFQCYDLFNLIKGMRGELHAEWLYAANIDDGQNRLSQNISWAKHVVDSQKTNLAKRTFIPLLCQLLSNRFFPRTQSDRRIFVAYRDWQKYCNRWDSKQFLKEIDISIEELKNIHEQVSLCAQVIDPLEHWYELVSFISVEEKKQLKGYALLAQSFYHMEQMIGLFLEDCSGDKYSPPSEGLGWRREMYYGKGIVEDNLKYLEFLSNRYHLNPRPRLILFVEGNGEEEQFPRLSKELFNRPFHKLGIEVKNLHGIGEFTGRKKKDKYGALEKFIDDYHYRGTIVFFVLDNEGRASDIKKNLLEATSKLNKKRNVTKFEYIVIWGKKTIEFENFSNIEIAQAMTAVCDNLFTFNESEIEDCRLQTSLKDADHLSTLFRKKTGYDLSKPKLLARLFSCIIDNRKNEFTSDGEPIRSVVKVILQIIKLASFNHQPTCLDSWEKNQGSGYFGDIIEMKNSDGE